jgi:cobyrinic acid a,c-diamide synthase
VIPRVVIAGPSSGSGKTTVACGLIGALRARGLEVQGFKVGPDYIDPSHHALASGRPGRNLDAFLSGPELIAPLVRHGEQGADIAVIVGVLGMFDGASGRGELASTAHVAKLLLAPVILVVDASAMARSAAAIVHGFHTFDPNVNVAGVIFNRVGSDHHEELLRQAVEPLGLPVLGTLRRDERIATPERHLGLVPAGEREAQALVALATLSDAISRTVDLDAVLELSRSAGDLPGPSWDPAEGLAPTTGTARARRAAPRIALAAGPAFSFHYRENLELLEAAGAELLPFDPIRDEALPEATDALLLAGGFPEVYGAELAANGSLRGEIAALARAGRPVLAECGGLLYLCETLDEHVMCGVLSVRGHMSGRLSLGYREATALAPTPWLRVGDHVRGHEFHYSTVDPLHGGEKAAWTLTARGMSRPEGFVSGSVQASYLHVHWAAHPQLARHFAAAAATRAVGAA